MGYPLTLNGWSRPIRTDSAEAQVWFDRGLNWLYGYNHEEAVTCFEAAARADPGCPMAWWGIALAAGPFYNRPWLRYTRAEAEATLAISHDAATQAAALAGPANPADAALIVAIGRRYANPNHTDMADLYLWQDDYADAMRAAHRAHPGDPDIAALTAEALVTRTPRQLWDIHTGQPKAGADTLEALAIIESGLRQTAAAGLVHPGLLHMHIHALEMAPNPEAALASADTLRDLARDEGHLHHMPAHIYVQVGDYAQAVAVSRRAVAVDNAYAAHAGSRNFYTTARCHDLHLLMFAAMFLGQYRTALDAADAIRGFVTPDLLDAEHPFFASILDGYSAMRTHVQVRFGRWRDLIAEPPPPHPDLTPLRVAMHAYGRAVAHAALGHVPDAEAAQRAFHAAAARIPENAIFLSNPTRTMLGVAEKMIEGELEYRKRNYSTAFAALREAAARDDALNYTEPWAWMHPPRHALGALLAEQGRFAEAEQTYREDLGLVPGVARCCQHPDNIWALAGLLECVEKRGDGAEGPLLRQRLTIARARADVPVTAACCCRGGP